MQVGSSGFTAGIQTLARRVTTLRARNRLRTVAALPRLLRVRDVGVGVGSSVLVCGEMRSGTTWLGTLIAQSIGGREIFEPLNEHFTDFPGLPTPLYADASTNDPALEVACRRILSGRLLPNLFVNGETRPGTYSARVVKDLRLAWALPFIRARFPQCTVVYIVRNPLGCLRSQLQQAAENQLTISRGYYDRLRSHPKLDQLVWSRFGCPNLSENEYAEYKLASWACHQRLVLDQLEQDSGILLVSYDLMMAQPALVAGGLRDALVKAGFPARELSLEELRRPSHTTHRAERQHVSRGEGLDKWRGYFSDEQLARYRAILGHFGLADLYVEEGSPGLTLARRCVGGVALGQ